MRFSYYLSLFILFYSPFCFSSEYFLNKDAIASAAFSGDLHDIITNAQHTPANTPLSKYTGAFVLPLIIEQHSKALKDPAFNPLYLSNYNDARHLAQSGYISEAIALTPILYPSDVLVSLLLAQSSNNFVMVDVFGQNVDKDYFNGFYSIKKAMISVFPLSSADVTRRVNQEKAYEKDTSPYGSSYSSYGILVPNASLSGSSTSVQFYNGSSWEPVTYTQQRAGTNDKNEIVKFYVEKMEALATQKCIEFSVEGPAYSCILKKSATLSEIRGDYFYIYLTLLDRDGWDIWDAYGRYSFLEFSGSFTIVSNPDVQCPDGTARYQVLSNGVMVCRPDFTRDDSASLYTSIGYTPDYEVYPNGSIKVHPSKVFSKTWPNFVSLHPDAISFYSPNNSNAEVVNRFHIYYMGDLKYKVDREVTGIKFVRDKFERKDENGQEKYAPSETFFQDLDLSFHYIYNFDSLGILENLTVSYDGSALALNPEADSVTSGVFGLRDLPMIQQFGLATLPPLSSSGTGSSSGGSGSGSSSGGPACGYDEEHKCAVDFGEKVPPDNSNEEEPTAPTTDMLKEAIFGKDFMKSFTGEGLVSTDNGECPSVSLNLTNFLKPGAFGKYDYDGHCKVLNKNLSLLGGNAPFDFIRVMFVVSWLLIAIYRVLSA